MNNVIEENQPSLVELSLVGRHPQNPDLQLVPASFVCHQAVRVVRTATSKHITQRREGQAAHVAIVLQFSDAGEIRNLQQHHPLQTRPHSKDLRVLVNGHEVSIHRRSTRSQTSLRGPQHSTSLKERSTQLELVKEQQGRFHREAVRAGTTASHKEDQCPNQVRQLTSMCKSAQTLTKNPI